MGSVRLALAMAAVAACSTTRTPAPVAVTSVEVPACRLACDGAELVPQPIEVVPQQTEPPAFYARTTAEATRVFGDMQPALLRCYSDRVELAPYAKGHVTLDVLVDPRGHVRIVDVVGGEQLGRKTVACMVDRVKTAAFEPLPGRGPRHIRMPFTLRRQGVDERMGP